MYIRRGRLSPGDVVHEWNGIRFVWNRDKAESNLRKHGVSFEAACEVIFDPFVSLLSSTMIGGEERETTIGLTEDWNLLVIVCTFRAEVIRIISARPATSRERAAYEEKTDP
jgi:uncharacterized DUF497 family protein